MTQNPTENSQPGRDWNGIRRCLDDASTGAIDNLSEKVAMGYPVETYFKDCRAMSSA